MPCLLPYFCCMPMTGIAERSSTRFGRLTWDLRANQKYDTITPTTDHTDTAAQYGQAAYGSVEHLSMILPGPIYFEMDDCWINVSTQHNRVTEITAGRNGQTLDDAVAQMRRIMRDQGVSDKGGLDRLLADFKREGPRKRYDFNNFAVDAGGRSFRILYADRSYSTDRWLISASFRVN